MTKRNLKYEFLRRKRVPLHYWESVLTIRKKKTRTSISREEKLFLNIPLKKKRRKKKKEGAHLP